MRSALSILFLLILSCCHGQAQQLQQSRHGWYLSPHGTIRILLIFAEIEYDVNPANDPQPEGAAHWPKGELPVWKDDVFDPQPLAVPNAMVSRYYYDISLGQYTVLGDYIDQLITIRESDHASIRQAHGLSKIAVTEANKMDRFRTHHGLTVEDFDLWKRGGKAGMPKEAGPDDPHSFDHVMVILRNSGLTHGQGSVDPGSPGELFGYKADSQSRFGGMNALPFEILKHEFNHLLLGGNNFHSGGGNAAQFPGHFISLQGGWSMMGASGSSLLTCSGWDRFRLGWFPEESQFNINARDAGGKPINGDLDPIAGDTGIYVIRDFVTTGDALRIRMPFIPEELHQQWLWIENHQGYPRNGSPTDRFHYEDTRCVDGIEPGLFMVMQVAHEDHEGANIYGGHADYLRPIPANGMYDMSMRGDTLFQRCPFGGNSIPFLIGKERMNPLSGNHEQELPVYDRNNDGILEGGEHYVPGTRIRNGREDGEMKFLGSPDHAFMMNGNRKLGMGTNPSSANMMTLVSSGKKVLYQGGAPNVRTVYLNGLSVELIGMDQAGNASIRVRTNDIRLAEDVRWCADSIVLPPLRGPEGRSMIVGERVSLTIDRSLTPTRIDEPDTSKGTIWYSDPTRFVISEGASILMEPRSKIKLQNSSEIHMMPGSELVLQRKARLQIANDCTIYLHGNAHIQGEDRRVGKLKRKGRIKVVTNDQ